MNDEQRQALLAVASSATPADLSILDAALMDLGPVRPALLTTMPGSNNDKLWSQMVAVGWMNEVDPVDSRVLSKLYAINPSAGEDVRAFLADNSRANAMTAALNEFREKVPPMLIGAVHAANGTPSDLAILLAGIVERTMRRAIKPELP